MVPCRMMDPDTHLVSAGEGVELVLPSPSSILRHILQVLEPCFIQVILRSLAEVNLSTTTPSLLVLGVSTTYIDFNEVLEVQWVAGHVANDSLSYFPIPAFVAVVLIRQRAEQTVSLNKVSETEF